MDILSLSVCAVISGAEGWEDIEDFCKLELDWLRQYRPFEQGIPHHDTIARVIYRYKPEEIENAFQNWISALGWCGCLFSVTPKRRFTTIL